MGRSPIRWVLTTAALAALVASTSPAGAEGPGTPSQPPPNLPPPDAQAHPQAQQAQQPSQLPDYRTYQRRRGKPPSRWYGWQTLMCDGISIVTSPLIIGIGGYFFAPPIVHWAHGQVGKGFADLGIRIGAPIALGFAGAGLFGSGGGSDEGAIVGAALGVLFGVFGAIAVDAAVLAYVPEDDDDDDAMNRAKRQNARLPVIMPMLVPRMEGGAVFGLSGSL